VGPRYRAHGRGSALARARRPHIGPAARAGQRFPYSPALDRRDARQPQLDTLRASAEASTLKIVPLAAPNRFALGGARSICWRRFPDYVPSDAPKNDDSLVLRIRYGRHLFLLTGDLERPIERRMPKTKSGTPMCSRSPVTATPFRTERFVCAVQPAFAVISVGFENSWGHPHRDVMQRLEEHHAAVLRRDLDGLVSILSDGRRLQVEKRGPSAGIPTPWLP
jgi:competence protein ComEC